jgi:fucose permease
VRRLLVLLSGLAFISLGLPDGLLGVAWPSIRAFFDRDLDALGSLLIAATGGYVASSFASGRVLRHANLGVVLAVSCLLTAIALLGYVWSMHWASIVALAVVLGLGGGAIDAALNTYAATNHGPRTLNWLHACYGIGAALGPMVMTAVLERGIHWQRGYAIVGLAQLALAGSFALTLKMWPRTSATGAAAAGEIVTTIRGTLGLPAARLAIATFIAYAGVEASFGAWTYTLLTAGRGMSPIEAGTAVSLFWGSLTAGRLIAASGGGFVVVGRMLNVAVTSVAVGAVLVWMSDTPTWTLIGVAIVGCACGPIFPTLVATTPARLGATHTANAVGLQIAAAALGLSLVPAFVGIVADAAGVETIATLLVALALLLVVVYRLLDAVAPVPAEASGVVSRG